MNIRDICGALGITVAQFYKYMHTTQAKLSYYNKKNRTRYKDTIIAGIINFYGISREELLTILKLYDLQKNK